MSRFHITIPAGKNHNEVVVPISKDEEVEGDETLILKISNPRGAYIDDAEGTGTIQDDDEADDN